MHNGSIYEKRILNSCSQNQISSLNPKGFKMTYGGFELVKRLQNKSVGYGVADVVDVCSLVGDFLDC